MEQRSIAGFDVSLLGLGTSRLASLGSRRSKADAGDLLSAARDCGINLIDTADTYGSTAAERWIGELTAHESHSWVIVTKTGLPTVNLPGPFRVFNQPAKKLKQAVTREAFALDPRTLRNKIQQSLRRLRRERIEIFLLHLPPEGIVNDDETRDILQDAQRTGIVAEFGVSSDNPPLIRQIHQVWGSACAEIGINPLHTPASDWELADLDLIANHVMAAAGEQLPPPSDGATDQKPLTARHRLLRHAAATPGVKVVLTGTSNPEHLRENAAALERHVSSADLIS